MEQVVKLNPDATLRIVKKVSELTEEQRAKPDDQRRPRERLVEDAYRLEKEGKL